MELFTKLFGSLLVLVYHCFDRIVIHGYLSALTRPEQVVYFFRQVVGVEAVDKEVLSRRTGEYQDWVEAFARNHDTPIEWAEKGVRKEDYVQRWLRSMVRGRRYGVYFIFKSMEQGQTFRCTVPKYPTKDPHHRILAPQRSRFTHYYFDLRDETLGPVAMRVASFFPFQTTYYLDHPVLAGVDVIPGGVAARDAGGDDDVKAGSGGSGPQCLTPLELLDRLAALVPPPRRHRHRYFGVLAPSSPRREPRARRSRGATRERGRTAPR